MRTYALSVNHDRLFVRRFVLSAGRYHCVCRSVCIQNGGRRANGKGLMIKSHHIYIYSSVQRERLPGAENNIYTCVCVYIKLWGSADTGFPVVEAAAAAAVARATLIVPENDVILPRSFSPYTPSPTVSSTATPLPRTIRAVCIYILLNGCTKRATNSANKQFRWMGSYTCIRAYNKIKRVPKRDGTVSLGSRSAARRGRRDEVI